MATIQQSIDVNMSPHAVYKQLSRFEDYPRFIEDVETVRQIDDTHLYWRIRMANRPVEWEALIIEQEQDHCIAWHAANGPAMLSKVEVQALGPDTSKLVFTVEAQPGQFPGLVAGGDEQEMTQRLIENLVRLKKFIEARGWEIGAGRVESHDAGVVQRDRDPGRQANAAPGQQPRQMAFQNAVQIDAVSRTGKQPSRR